MGFGVSSASFFPTLTEDTVEIMKGIGIERCEFFLEAEAEYDLEYIRLLKERCETYGITPVSVHSFCSAFEPFIFTSYERRRKDCMKTFYRVLAAAQALGAMFYTFHGEMDKDVFDLDTYSEKYSVLAATAEEYGIILAQENVSWCLSSRPEFISGVIDRVNSPYLKATLDIKQAYRAGRTPSDYIKLLGNNIVNVHINDRSEVQSCMLPGQGCVDFEKLFCDLEQVGYQGDYILEVYRRDYEDYEELGQAVNYLKNIKMV